MDGWFSCNEHCHLNSRTKDWGTPALRILIKLVSSIWRMTFKQNWWVSLLILETVVQPNNMNRNNCDRQPQNGIATAVWNLAVWNLAGS